MKIFISQPMRGLDDATIKTRREKAIASLMEMYPGCGVIDTFYEGESTPDNPLQLLGRAISMLNDVDAIYMLDGWADANGCCIEHECAIRYGIKVIYEKQNLSKPMKDYIEAIMAEQNELRRIHSCLRGRKPEDPENSCSN
jgi:hypothetical protein